MLFFKLSLCNCLFLCPLYFIILDLLFLIFYLFNLNSPYIFPSLFLFSSLFNLYLHSLLNFHILFYLFLKCSMIILHFYILPFLYPPFNFLVLIHNYLLYFNCITIISYSLLSSSILLILLSPFSF